MKGKILFFMVILGLAGLMFGCGKKKEAREMEMPAEIEQPATTQEKAVYTCLMHPDVVSDKPEKCSKCGMNLVPKE